MALFNNFTIRKKLIGILLAVTIISLLIGFSLEVYSNILASKKELVDNISLNAKLISDYSVPAILFDDKDAAENILVKLRNITSVLFGVIYDNKGVAFATYFKSGYENTTAITQADSSTVVQKRLVFISEPIISENDIIGRVDLIASTDVIKATTFRHLKVIIIIFLGSVFIAFILSVLLERLISKPIIDLASTAQTIRDSGDLTLRARKSTNDETGTLYDSFNDLLISLSARKEERDLAEKQLLEERENLEKRVLERTNELKTAKEKAEESDRLKSSFISNFSHEIRTPLNAIIGFTDLLLEGMNTDEEKAFAVKSINDSKDDLLQLINNILDTSNLETNQLYIQTSDFKINDEIINIVNFGNDQLNRRNKKLIQIRTNIGSTEGIIISTDGKRLIQVIKQLVNNAVKYTNEGFIEIGTYLPDQKFVGFFVKDTGCGFPEDEKEKIFNRFYKVETDKNNLYRGAGLGLTLAKGIVVNLNGDMWVESEPGIGSTFFFKIPFITNSIKADLMVENEQTDNSALAGKKILIAEDNFNIYSYLSLVTKRCKMEPINAKNGLEAIYLNNEYKFDLVLMDILMPKMDGFEAAKKIRIKSPSMPIIAQTAFNFSKDDQNLLELFDDVLIKPILPADLIKTLTKHLVRNPSGKDY